MIFNRTPIELHYGSGKSPDLIATGQGRVKP